MCAQRYEENYLLVPDEVHWHFKLVHFERQKNTAHFHEHIPKLKGINVQKHIIPSFIIKPPWGTRHKLAMLTCRDTSLVSMELVIPRSNSGTYFGANLIFTSTSSSAFGSPTRGTKSTMRSSFTANTVSLSTKTRLDLAFGPILHIAKCNLR